MLPTSKMSPDHTLGLNGKFVRNWCETECSIHEVDYVWVIHNYNFYKANLSKDEFLKSSVFETATDTGCKWYLELYPNGYQADGITNPALYLYLDDNSYYDRAMATCKISILDGNQKEVHVKEETNFKLFEKGVDAKSWGFKTFFENDFALPLSDRLTIYCEIKFSLLDNITNVNDKSKSELNSNIPKPRLCRDLGQLFNNEESSDVVISVQSKNFKAHKLILSARSPVFAAMFKHKNMKESQESNVIIVDFDAPTVEEMLKYIYTDQSENLNKLADKLLAIAEKYELDGLKDMSARALMKNTSVNNAIDNLLFADFHGARELKSDIIKFIVNKYGQVMKTTAWKNIIVSHPQLVVEVCEALPN